MSKKSYDFLDKSIKKIITSKSSNSDNNNFLTNAMGNFNKPKINSVNSNSLSISKNSFNSNSSFNSFPNLKPKKQFMLAGKSVQVFNNNPIPNKKVIENTYNQIPDDKNVPLQFMTRKQYYETYAKNQECVNGKPFNKEQKQQFFKSAKKRYGNIIGRYTTESNPYYAPAVVVFNDKDNLPNIKGKKFKDLAWHEFGHEYVEEKQIKMPLHKEEMFADRLAMNKTMQRQVNLDMSYNNTNSLKTDVNSKNDIVYHGTTPMGAMLIKRQGILTSNELKKQGAPYHTLSDKTKPDKTYFFKDKPRAESWARVATQNSMFPNAVPKVVVADVPGNELIPDLGMETGGAFYKEGGVKPKQIISLYDVEQDSESKNDTSNLYTWQSPDKEIAKNPEPANDSTRKRMTPGRSTGWTGSGIYAYSDKLQATRESEDSPNLYKGRKLYKIKVEKPLVFPFKGYDKFMNASKHHRMLNEGSFINDKPFIGQVLREYNEAGIKTTEKQLFNTMVNSQKNNMLPSTLLLKEQGFDSVIADKENNTYMTGSVALGRKGDFQNKLIETDPYNITKEEYDLYDWNKHKQKEPSYQSQSKKKLIRDALMKTSERGEYQDYSDFYDEKKNEAYLDKYKDPKEQQELLSKYEQIKVQEQKEKNDFYRNRNTSKAEEELKLLLLKHEILNGK